MKQNETVNQTNLKFRALAVIWEDCVDLSSKISNWYNH